MCDAYIPSVGIAKPADVFDNEPPFSLTEIVLAADPSYVPPSEISIPSPSVRSDKFILLGFRFVIPAPLPYKYDADMSLVTDILPVNPWTFAASSPH